MSVDRDGRKLLRLEVRNAETPIERKPPWINLVDDDEVCDARSSCSAHITDTPRPAKSRASPTPLIPPPTTSTSNGLTPSALR